MENNKKIVIVKNGPYIVSGNIPLFNEIVDGEKHKFHVHANWGAKKKLDSNEKYTLCRCGKSKKHPYCDGIHVKTKFDGTETAKRKNFFETAVRYDGKNLILYDEESLCFEVGFCHSKKGGTWELIDGRYPNLEKLAIEQACNCPSGRLVIYDKLSKKVIEPKLEKSISTLQEKPRSVSGPLFIKGGIPIISSDGFTYEIRNRVTLCRCGESKNKPYCDSEHIKINFKDGLKD